MTNLYFEALRALITTTFKSNTGRDKTPRIRKANKRLPGASSCPALLARVSTPSKCCVEKTNTLYASRGVACLVDVKVQRWPQNTAEAQK
ncbi:hypothetical protein E2C01_084790 [Portunus trituberculatus]|uniref:Uncharacterized protein n=1 Tax=Portunus trituberculatus TaxID=210409 RepID=A0A5B7IZ80_PORTR|nr:hypothetical protein [Portunus trituberculatus]